MFRVFSAPHRRRTLDEPLASKDGNYVSIALGNDFRRSEFYSDNDEEHEEYVIARSKKKKYNSSGSVKSFGSNRSNRSNRSLPMLQRRRSQKCEDRLNTSAPELDDILKSFASKRDPSRERVIVPSKTIARGHVGNPKPNQDNDDDNSSEDSYHSGFSSSESSGSFVSAAQSASESIRSKSSRQRILQVLRLKKKQKSEGNVAVAVARTESKKTRRGFRNKFRRRNEDDTKSRATESDMRSQASSIFGFSVGSMSIGRILRRKKRHEDAEQTERTGTSESVPAEVGIVPLRRIKKQHGTPATASTSSVGSDKPVRLTKFRPQKSPKKSALKKSSLLSGRTKDDDSGIVLSDGSIKKMKARKKKTYPGKSSPSRSESGSQVGQSAESSLADALRQTASFHQRTSVPDFEPRLEDPDTPLLGVDHNGGGESDDNVSVRLDILDLELVLTRGDEKDGDFLYDDDVSSLSSGSSLTLASSSPPRLDTSTDDYGVYDRSRRSRASRSVPLSSINVDTRITTILNGELPPSDDVDATYAMPTSIKMGQNRSLSLLLLHTGLKIFEIVEITVSRTTTVGETIARAKKAAIDGTLSKQDYSSLCNDVNQLFESAQVGKLAPWNSRLTQLLLTDEDKKKEMERCLLVAVPTDAKSSECRKIRRMLWKNPKLQAWWKATLHARSRLDPPK